MIYVLALLGIVALGVGAWWLSVWAWRPTKEDEIAPELPRRLDEWQARRGVRRGERIP